jgi:hypothetical protein
MNALAIVEAATAEGLIVDLSQNGSLKVVGDQETVDRWRPRLKQHKAEIINLLNAKPGGVVKATRPTLPSWCNSMCKHFHRLDVPEVGILQWCCQEEDSTHWRRDRIDCMSDCPLPWRR